MAREDYGRCSGVYNDEYESSRTASLGRGPQGYRRSDERIMDEVVDHLTRHGYIDATNIQITVNNGEVTLEGSVEERQQKFMAEDAAAQVSGVTDVHNRLRVGVRQNTRERAKEIFSG
jgi:osmotically-inducible protein OsmY